MLRSSLTTAGVFALSAAAFAQSDAATRVRPATTPRDGGTFHVGSNTWTRKAQAANIGADIIYNNTCSTGYYSPLSGDRFVDEGRIPSPTSPTNLTSRPGCNASYTIDGFQIAYCTDQIGFAASTTTVNFYQLYAPCATVVGVTPTAGFAISGLPGTTGVAVCWIVTLDLDSPPLTASLAFAMQADGDGAFAAPENTNLFGWSIENNMADANQLATGPLISGDPNVCTKYDGTRWDSPINYAEAGTGMGSFDQFRIEDGPTTPGCYFFGGNPFAAFHLELYSDACGPILTPPTPFCPGDGTGTACPCANNSPAGQNDGCLSSLGVGARLRTSGANSISGDTLVLNGSQMPNSSCLYFQGTIQQSGGAGAAFGDGKRCAGGTVIRLKTVTNVGGASQYPQAGDPSVSVRGMVTTPGTRTYQAWYRNAAAFCTAATFNLSNGLEYTWIP
jgi:hypothetical protein